MQSADGGFFSATAGEQWIRFLAATPDVVVFLTTPEGIIREWLGAAERVTGYSAADAIGQSLSIFFPAEDRQRGLDRHELALVHSTGVAECDRWNLRRDGSRFWASGVLTAIRGSDGEVVALCKVMRDKTDVRFQIESLEHKLAQRDSEATAARNFVAATAHELRNPLMPVLSAVALLKRPDSAQVSARAIQILENQVAVLKALVDDLDHEVRAPQSDEELVLVPVNLSEALRGMAVTSGQDAQTRQIRFSLVLPAADLYVKADPPRLQQILLNLVGNALKYTRSGGSVDVSASVEANMVVVRIEDDGVGISAEALPHIFELFTREGRQREIAGMGVGLSVVKELVRKLGGMVEARSPGPDKGSVFGLRLPVLENPAA